VVAPVYSSGWRVELGPSVAEAEAAGAVEDFLRPAGQPFWRADFSYSSRLAGRRDPFTPRPLAG
jgi:hypothetical protein